MWTGILNAADYGVPQTRRRAILIASRTRTAVPPEPTHARHGEPESLFGPGRARWVSMAEALGWGRTDGPVPTVCAGGGPGGGPEPFPSGSRKTLAAARDRGAWKHPPPRTTPPRTTRSAPRTTTCPCATPDPVCCPARRGGWQWALRSNSQANASVRPVSEPAGTLFFGNRANECVWTPVTTAPARAKPLREVPAAIRITDTEAGILQSFPANYPWQGNKGQRFSQIGNAVPPLLAAHLITQHLQRTTIRPGPAPATDTEQVIAAALTPAPPAPAAHEAEPVALVVETVPVYAADPGDHEQLLEAFFDAHPDWDKVRTWGDEATFASHETLTQRVEFIHESVHDDVVWTLACYDSPVSDRRWHATATRSTPAELITTLLDAFERDGDGPAVVTEQTLTRITRPLADAGWQPVIDGSSVTWTAPDGGADLRFDAHAYGRPDSPLPAWTLRGLHNGTPNPAWTMGFSRDTPETLLDTLAFDLAHESGTRLAQTPLSTSAAQAQVAGPPPTLPASPRPSAHR